MDSETLNHGGLEFGIFHEFQRRPGMTEAQAFQELFEQVDAAEAAGLERHVAGRTAQCP